MPVLANGGAKGDRTLDLHNAIVALSQLSYRPSSIEMLCPFSILSRFVKQSPLQGSDTL